MTPPTTVFVYGTLMPGERNEPVALRGGPYAARPATLRGYQLFHLSPEGYPGLRPGQPDDTVRGVALTYQAHDWPAALPFLDHLEGLHERPPLYTRERVQLNVPGEDPLDAWVYVYARPDRLTQPGAQAVPSGDWRDVPGREARGPDER